MTLTKAVFEQLQAEHGRLAAHRLMGLELVFRPLDRESYRDAVQRVSQEQQRGQSGDHSRAAVVRERLVYPSLDEFNAALSARPALARKAHELLLEVAGEVLPMVVPDGDHYLIEGAGETLRVRPLTRPEYDRLRTEVSKAQQGSGNQVAALEKALRVATVEPTGEELTALLDRHPGLLGAVTAELAKLAGEAEEAEEITFL